MDSAIQGEITVLLPLRDYKLSDERKLNCRDDQVLRDRGHRQQLSQRARQVTAVGSGHILMVVRQSGRAPMAYAVGAVG